MTRVLGIHIANGFSPEARVFAGLLRHGPAEHAHVLHHSWPGDPQAAARFRDASGSRVHSLDFGWRSVGGGRGLRERVTGRLRLLATLPRALRLAREVEPEVIYSSQQLWDCITATYLARRLRRPQVIHLHYTVGPWLHRPVLRRLRECTHVLCISEFIRDEALRHGVAADRMSVIKNTLELPAEPSAAARVEVRAELGMAPNAPTVGMVARLDPTKGQEDALHAFARLLPEVSGCRLILVGGETPWHPGYRNRLEALAAELGVARSVDFLGMRNDVPRLLSALDVFVHPARREPFGLAMAEASAHRLPVVSYADGGTPEVVEHGVTGLLASPGDTGEVAAHLLRLITDPSLARRMGEAGRKRIGTEFQPAAAGEAFASLISTLCLSSGRHAGGVAGEPGPVRQRRPVEDGGCPL